MRAEPCTCARRASRSARSTKTASSRGRRWSAGPSSSSSCPTGAPASATRSVIVQPVERHPFAADVSFDGGDLDCGNGLLLLIRQHMDPMARGQLLEFRSTEISVDEDFPAWCRMTGNELVSFVRQGTQRRSEEHTSELQSPCNLVCRVLLEKKKHIPPIR